MCGSSRQLFHSDSVLYAMTDVLGHWGLSATVFPIKIWPCTLKARVHLPTQRTHCQRGPPPQGREEDCSSTQLPIWATQHSSPRAFIHSFLHLFAQSFIHSFIQQRVIESPLSALTVQGTGGKPGWLELRWAVSGLQRCSCKRAGGGWAGPH